MRSPTGSLLAGVTTATRPSKAGAPVMLPTRFGPTLTAGLACCLVSGSEPARTLEAGRLWPVSLLRWGEQQAVSCPGAGGRVPGSPKLAPGLAALRGHAGARWVKPSCRFVRSPADFPSIG